MKKIKNYENKDLEILLRTIFNNKYGIFTPIVIDIFKRYAYEYNYSIEEMNKRAITFKKNIKTIEIVTEDTGKIEKNVLGSYDIENERIVFNKTLLKERNNFFKKNYDGKIAKELMIKELYSVMAHECVHAINYYKTIRGYGTGLLYKPLARKGNKTYIGTAFNEAWNESGSSRLLRTGREKEIYEPQITNGYEQISFLPSLLATTCGLTDKEVFKAGMEGRASLYKTISQNFTSLNEQKASLKLVEIEQKLDYLYRDTVSRQLKINKNSQPINYKCLDELLESSLKLLKDDIDEIARVNSPKRVGKTYEEYKYRIDRATYISLRALKYYLDDGFIDENAYNYCVKRARDRRKGLTIYLEQIDIPHDVENRYVKKILEEDLDEGRTWEFPQVVKDSMIELIGEETFIQRLLKLTKNSKPEQNIKQGSKQINQLSTNMRNNRKKENKRKEDKEYW